MVDQQPTFAGVQPSGVQPSGEAEAGECKGKVQQESGRDETAKLLVPCFHDVWVFLEDSAQAVAAAPQLVYEQMTKNIFTRDDTKKPSNGHVDKENNIKLNSSISSSISYKKILFPFLIALFICYVNAQQNCYRSLTANDVAKQAGRRHLNFSHGQHEKIEENAFANGTEAATFLELSYNFLTTVQENLFDNMPNLIEVDMIYNAFSYFSIALQRLGSQKKLLNLNLMGNLIRYIGEDDLKGMESVERIDLSNNKIETIHDRALDYLTSLTTATFSENKLTALPQFNLTKLVKLKHIDFQNNTLKSLSIEHFSNTPGITNITITNENMSISFTNGTPVVISISGNNETISCEKNLQDIRNSNVNINYTLFCQDHPAHPHQIEGFNTSQSDPTSTEISGTFSDPEMSGNFSGPTPTTNCEGRVIIGLSIGLGLCFLTLVVGVAVVVIMWCKGIVVINMKSPQMVKKEGDQDQKVEKNGLMNSKV